jgi:hypothetical protein
VGGNSMVLVKVNGKLKDAFSKEIPLVALFQHTTVKSLAEFIQAGETAPKADIFDKEKDKEQADAMDEGKNRMKRFIRKSKEVGNE